MTCEEDDYEVDPTVSEAAGKLRDLGLFVDLDDNRIKQLMRLGDEGDVKIEPDALRSVIEAHLREPHEDVISLASPQSVEDFTSVIDADVSEVFFADPDPTIAHLIGRQYAIAFGDEANADAYREMVMLEPRSHDEWVGCYNAALAAIGDERRFVSFDVADWEEPIYVLCNDVQHAALGDAKLTSFTADEVKLPSGLWANSRAERLANNLTLKRVPARAEGEQVILESTAVIDTLRDQGHHSVRMVDAPVTAADARAQLLVLIGASPEDVIAEPAGLRLTIRGAALLDRIVEWARLPG